MFQRRLCCQEMTPGMRKNNLALHVAEAESRNMQNDFFNESKGQTHCCPSLWMTKLEWKQMWCLLQDLALHLLMFLKVSQQLVHLSLSFNKSVAYLHLFPFFASSSFYHNSKWERKSSKNGAWLQKTMWMFPKMFQKPRDAGSSSFSAAGVWVRLRIWTDVRGRCEVATRREQWEPWLLARRSARLITDGDVPEENYLTFLFSCVWVARSNANHLLGNKLDPYQLLTERCFLQKAGRCPPIWLGKIQL